MVSVNSKDSNQPRKSKIKLKIWQGHKLEISVENKDFLVPRMVLKSLLFSHKVPQIVASSYKIFVKTEEHEEEEHPLFKTTTTLHSKT